MNILIVGSTGEVGNQLLQAAQQQKSINHIYTFVRNTNDEEHDKTTSITIDFDDITSLETIDVDAVFCCLGTTIKKAGSKSQFEKVDYEYVVSIGEYAKRCGAKQFHVVSANGADATSRIFYSATKGKMEDSIKSLNLPSTYIYRPALLDSERKEKRFGERIAVVLFRIINPLLIGSLKRYASIKVEKVASGMLTRSLKPEQGFHIIESNHI